jgi:hypothetical protein
MGSGPTTKAVPGAEAQHCAVPEPRPSTAIEDSARAAAAKVARVSFTGASMASPAAAGSPAAGAEAGEGETRSGRAAEALAVVGGDLKPAGQAQDEAVFVRLEEMGGESIEESEAVGSFSLVAVCL